jgi:hypothetical protein
VKNEESVAEKFAQARETTLHLAILTRRGLRETTILKEIELWCAYCIYISDGKTGYF